MHQNEQNFLRDAALNFGIELSPQHLNLFRIYLAELIEWNRRINLTGLSAPKSMINELFLDSLIPVPFLPDEGRMLDVGSGAGFPGIPISIYYPRLKTHLMDANAKKVSFLKQVIRLTKLENIKVIKGRIERDGGYLHAEGYNLITARALSGLDQIITWCSPFLCHDGLLVGFLGSGAEKDLEKSKYARESESLIVYKKLSYILPEKQSMRTLVILKKKSF